MARKLHYSGRYKMRSMSIKKYNTLWLSLLLDAIGMISYTLPGIGEFTDVIWAPVSAWLMYRMYGGLDGKIAAGLTFVEEILPGMDFIPAFTLMWLYRRIANRK